MTAPADDPARWSTRYYRAQCPDLTFTVKTDGPDDRDDPPADYRQPCLLEHDPHPLVRISPDEYERLTSDDEDEADEPDDD